MSAPEGARPGPLRSPPAPNARQQIGLLLELWWRHMRRRATRVGDAPKRTGVPGFLLINLISIGYLTPLVWRTVARDVTESDAFFTWHMLGMLVFAFGTGVSKGAAALQVRGMRNDAFLEALPLTPLASLALQLFDGLFMLLLALVVPLAASHVVGRPWSSALLSTLLGGFAYVVCFVLAYSLVAWARALGPTSVAKRAAYMGVALSLLGIASAVAPLAAVVGPHAVATTVARHWLGGPAQLVALYAGWLALLLAAYRALLGAERFGYDRLPIASAAPRAVKGVQSRVALEWQMIWRQGGKALLVMSGLMSCFFAWILLFVAPPARTAMVGLLIAGFIVYVAALQTIGLAGRAARGDLGARPFLSALPLSPHQVLDGKARALRVLLGPALAMLALVAAASAGYGNWDTSYRGLLALASLYLVVDGVIAVAFLASGVGVVGIGGGQASSSFSTQLLMMPLLTTVMASGVWPATVSFVAVVAVTREARRAAKLSLRWLDDADDGVERETTVWRALLAATAFFALQVFSFRLLDLFEVPAGYGMAASFAVAAVVLVLLTHRNRTRFERPRFLPRSAWFWLLGPVAGAGSGVSALAMLRLLPPAPTAEATQAFSSGELVAMAVTLVVIAPLAEEYFFRGWLQKAIEHDLPLAHKRWAFALGAVAFALAHVGTYGLPQLVLGLLAGALYAFGGGLWPAILAHATHNGVVLLAGQ